MITLYQASTGTFVPASGVGAPDLLLNILIELRVMNAILAGDAGTNSMESLRSDVINETNNPVI